MPCLRPGQTIHEHPCIYLSGLWGCFPKGSLIVFMKSLGADPRAASKGVPAILDARLAAPTQNRGVAVVARS